MVLDLRKKAWLPHPFTLLSGCLIVLSFPPWGLWGLIWVCLIPWLSVIRQAPTFKSAVIQGVWLSYFMCIAGFFWVAAVLTEFGGLPWVLSVLGLQLFSIFGQLQFCAFAPLLWMGFQKKKSSLIFPWVYALLYVALDWVLPKIFADTLGHAFYNAKYLRQVADLAGVYVLTFFAVQANLGFESLLHSLYQAEKMRWKVYRLGLILFFPILAWNYGYFRYQEVARMISHPLETVQGVAIQGNIGDFDKLAAESGAIQTANQIIDTFTELSDEAMRASLKPDFIIWPETAYPSIFRNPHTFPESRLNQRLEFYARKLDVPLFFGGYDEWAGQEFNSFFFLYPHAQEAARGDDLQVYRKHILLLFGEYIPGADSIRYIKEAFPQVGNFGRGDGPKRLIIPLSTPGKKRSIRISPAICYEALFSSFVLRAVREGSDLIMNITNDSWFGDWGEPQLHLSLTAFRAIETRLPLIRATNTGISAYITPTGDILHATRQGEKAILAATIPIFEPIPTLLKSWGDWFGLFALVVSAFTLLGSRLVNQSFRRT